MKIHTENFPGNLHAAATTINKRGWANLLVTLHAVSDGAAIGVFKMPDSMVYDLRRKSRSFSTDPHHDDVVAS